jgi:PAS domain S-box-containing protein
MIALAISMCVGIVAALILDARHQMSRLFTASQDNLQWSLVQLETEVLLLENAALRAAMDQPPDLDELRKRFDVFFSRHATLSRSSVMVGLRIRPGAAEEMKAIERYLDRWIPVMDGADTGLLAQLGRLEQDTALIRTDVRRLVVFGTEYFTRLSDGKRERTAGTLRRIAGLTISLVAVLLVLAGALFQLARHRAADAEHHSAIRQRIETILAASQDAVLVTDRSGTIIEYNGTAEKTFGYSVSEALGAQMSELIIPPDLRPEHNKGMARYLRKGEPRVLNKGTIQMRALRKDGQEFPADITIAKAESPDGQIFVGFVRDITARITSENALKRARDRAIAGEKHKAELLAVMSHEMRTPLNGLLGTLDLFDTTTLDEEQQQQINVLKSSGQQLLSHVNDVLDVTRMDAGKLSMHKALCDLPALLNEVIETQKGAASTNNTELQALPLSPLLKHAYTDRQRLRQILLNLIGNAVKFTHDGHITIEVDCLDGLNEVELRVSDTGQGISEDDLKRIFDDFVSIDTSYGRRNSGTGLGLGITRRLTRALGGDMGAESILGEGSVFWVRLPMHPPAHIKAGQGPDQPGRLSDSAALPEVAPQNILVVEDNEINRQVLKAMLVRDGHSVTLACNGEDGVKLAQDTRFDTILMDISMPGMDGIETTLAIRRIGPNHDTPVIATTAHALPNEVQAFRNAGMQDILIKPISADGLRQVLASRFNPAPATDQQSRARPSLPLLAAQHLDDLKETLPIGTLRASIAQFGQEMESFLANIPGTSQKRPQRDAIVSEAHRLAGSAGVLGALRLAEQLRALEGVAQEDAPAILSERASALAECWAETASLLARRQPAAPPK